MSRSLITDRSEAIRGHDIGDDIKLILVLVLTLMLGLTLVLMWVDAKYINVDTIL